MKLETKISLTVEKIQQCFESDNVGDLQTSQLESMLKTFIREVNNSLSVKSKVLCFKYFDNSGFKVVRVYNEIDFSQAQKDLDLLKEYSSDDKEWYLFDVENYNK